jgi:hypothetical protein
MASDSSTNYLTQTNSLGVVTGQPPAVTSPTPTPTIPSIPALGDGTTVITRSSATYTIVVSGTITKLLTSTNLGSSIAASTTFSTLQPKSTGSSPAATQESASGGGSAGIKVGTVVGIVIGVVVGLAIFAILGFLLYRRVQKRRSGDGLVQGTDDYRKAELDGNPVAKKEKLEHAHELPGQWNIRHELEGEGHYRSELQS